MTHDTVSNPFAVMQAMMSGGLPSIDQLPVERASCPQCEAIAPRISVLGFTAVVCPECRRVLVDEQH